MIGTKMDLSSEIIFQSTRSGGKGGQHVNKVETAVIGYLQVVGSALLTSEQQQLVADKLANRINAEGALVVRSQIHRSQAANKEEVIKRINELVKQALKKKKPRIATKPSRVVKEKRLESKKQHSGKKTERRKLRPGDY